MLYRNGLKRICDLAVSLLGIVVLSPVFVLVFLAVKFTSQGPGIFRHKRIGLGFAPFYVYKFRTMTGDAAKSGLKITVGGDSRVTRVGKILRKTKIDELPQLFNVLVGEMSLVGPRPEVDKYVEAFREDYKTILSVRPGITDYAAIEFHNEEALLVKYKDPEEGYVNEVLPAKIVLYKKYIAEFGFLTDIKILAQTFGKVISGALPW